MSKCRYCKLCEWANDGDKDFFGWCELRLDSYDIDEPRDCPDYIRASNADRIRAMNDHDLAVFLEHAMYDSSEPDWMTVLSWLQQPAEEET